jgi:hypothetical protein
MKHILFLLVAVFLIPWSREASVKNITKPRLKNKNSLTNMELQLIKGVGPVLSSDILKSSVPLREVRGVGEVRFKYLSQYISE